MVHFELTFVQGVQWEGGLISLQELLAIVHQKNSSFPLQNSLNIFAENQLARDPPFYSITYSK